MSKLGNTPETISFLQSTQDQLLNDTLTDVKPVLLHVLKSFDDYQAPNTRTHILSLIQSFITKGYDKEIELFIKKQSNGTFAASDYLNLLDWLYLLMNEDTKRYNEQLMILNNLVNKIIDIRLTSRTSRIFKTVVSNVKFNLGNTLSPERMDDVIKNFNLNTVSIMVMAILELQASKPQLYHHLESLVESIIQGYNKLVNDVSKPLPEFTLNLFSAFIKEFVNDDNISLITTNYEKLIMKNSEISLGYYIPFFCKYVQCSLPEKIVSKIVNGLKNSKENIRLHCYNTLKFIKYDNHQELINLCKTGTPDIKNLIFKLLADLKVDSEVFIPLVTKETNESNLSYLIHGFMSNLSSQTPETVKLINSGLTNKKLNLRRLWFLKLGEFANESFDFKDLDFNTSLKEYLASPIVMANNKGLSCVLLPIYFNKKFGVANSLVDEVISNDKFPITSLKVISKLTDQQDVYWAFKALNELPPVSSLVYLLADKNVPHESKRQGLEFVNSENTPIITDALIDHLKGSEGVDLDFKAINVLIKKLISFKVENSYKLAIIANHGPVNLKNSWIGLSQLANIDVKSFITENFSQIFDFVMDILIPNHPLYQSGIQTIGQLCFIVPEQTIPKLMDLFTIQFKDITTIDELSIQIWNNPTDLPVVNVLKTKEINKNSKNYETEKWENDLRKELKKVSKEEQKLINDQLAKEAQVKSEVQSKINNLIKNFDIINELIAISTSFDTNIETWYLKLMSLFTNILLPNYSLICQLTSKFSETFINLSSVTKLDNYFKQLVGVNSLKIYQNTDDWKDSTILNIFFRVKMMTDKANFNIITLSYMYPLIYHILTTGFDYALKSSKKMATTSEFVEEDPKEEQLMLAIDILSGNAELFANELLPRYEILEGLIKLMRIPSKFQIVKECFNALLTNISINYKVEDLEILFSNLIVPNNQIKSTILEILDSEFDLSDLPGKFRPEIWINCHDPSEQINKIADTIWSESEMVAPESSSFDMLIEFGNQEDSGLRLSVADTIVDNINQYPETLDKFIQYLIETYDIYSKPPPPKLDEYGLVIKTSTSDKDRWEIRSTIALILSKLTSLYSVDNIIDIFKFLVDRALGDQNELVRQELQDGGIDIIQYFELAKIEGLIPIFENSLSSKDNKIKESTVILYGSLGQHLTSDDSRVDSITQRLLVTLKTPSETVQIAISRCLSTITKLFNKSAITKMFEDLFNDLFTEKSVQVRMGAAYGISGLVKGLGIKSLTEYDIMRTLNDAVDDKKDPIKRESVSLVFYTLSFNLGKFFEPYVIEILPIMLKLLGDQVPEVRLATDKAAKKIMSNTTSFGVKKLIPLAISNLDEIAWRSKKGSVELLGAMAYLDPAQLSSSLSIIIPEIVGVLNDTHKEVRKAADQSLKRFGEVIRNPEIQKIVPDLIQAIGDPTKCTDKALDKLIKTQFVHYIDGPSLALIIHVIHRGMKDRSAQTKRKACQIVGNMAILVDTKDLKPYLNSLIQELEISMVDPVPATRSTAARALGSLVEKLGEEQFPDLIPKLLDNLQDESKQGDRLGSAQALSEIISGLGLSKLDELLPIILTQAKHTKNYIRAGFMPLLLYLPVCFGAQFAPYLSKIIPPILMGLADNDEEIRDMALRSGRLIVKNYAKVAIDLLLPELENGLNDTNYRIRLSSVELTGDLLFQVTGISGKNELLEEEEVEINGEINKSLIEILGKERRDKVLSLLFICRSDVNNLVRTKSIEIWKALVANTPRMIKEILGQLTEVVIKKLSSDDDVEKTIAATTLGEMVKRVGSNSLSSILPNMVELLDSNDENIKEGICIAVMELVKSSNEDGLREYQDTFLSITYKTLIDRSSRVRNAAAGCFDVLTTELGKVVIDEIIPKLLKMLESDDSEFALLALQDIMSTKADIIFPILIPTLLTPPIDTFKIKALSSLASVAGNALYKKLTLVINTFVDLILKETDENELTFIKSSFDQILLSINDNSGVNPLMQTLLSLTKHEDFRKRAIIFERLGEFFKSTTLDYSVYLNDMISSFILSLGDKSSDVVKGTFEALTSLVKAQPKDKLDKLVKPAQQSLMLTGVKGEELDGFKIARGPNCILPIFLQGLMYGNNEQKELSALGIADIIDKTPGDILKPFSTTITGPLIRVIGEKVNSNIKSAILIAINNLLLKIPQFLRPFIPQLQRTFVRLLSDPSNDELRSRAVLGLGILIKFQPRIDSLIIELISGCKNSESDDIKLTMLKALLEIIHKSGDKLNEASKQNIMNLIEDEMLVSQGKINLQYAKLLGSLSKIMNIDETTTIVQSKILTDDNKKFGIIGINAFLKEGDENLSNVIDDMITYVIGCSDINGDSYVKDNSVLAIGKLLLGNLVLSEDQQSTLVHQLCKLIHLHNSDSPNTVRLSIIIIRAVSRLKYEIIENNLDLVVPIIFNNVRSPIIPIKLAAEKCYLGVLNLVETDEIFNKWIEGKGDIKLEEFGINIVLRSINDYTKRVAMRLAKVEKERIELGGDEETVFSDRIEDENEIWSVGI